jgi:uncharacterized protein YndB with AHSA1/START domain
MKTRVTALLALVICLAASSAPAVVTDQSPGGFTCLTVHDSGAAPLAVWSALADDISQWWNPDHTWSGDAGNLFLGAVAGEEFGEALPGGGSVTHMEVVYADPGKLLRLRGSLGPLQGMAVTGVLSIDFAAVGEGTQLTVTYVVGGYAADGLETSAGPVDGVINEQFTRLVAYLAR